MAKGKILVVEDEEMVALDIKESLEDFGYEISGPVQEGAAAVRTALDDEPDLILMDVKLKDDIDGIDAARRIHAETDIPVIYLTAYADEETVARAKVTEPYGYLVKPYKELDLRTTVEIALFRSGKGTAARAVKEIEEEPKAPPKLDSENQDFAYGTLSRVEPFDRIASDDLTRLIRSARVEQYSAGEIIAFEGDTGDSGFVVAEGRVALVKSSASGKDLTVELLPPGDAYGVILALDGSSYPYTLQAQKDSRLIWIRRPEFMSILEKYPEVSQDFLRRVFDRLRSSYDLSRLLAHDSVEVRIASILSAIVPRFHSAAGGQNGGYQIEMTRQELADLIGSTQETTIRITKKMEREGILDLTQPGVIRVLKMEGLEDIASQDA